jgi:23S rRNA pseudouridine955/2504/2580 synthase
MAVDAREPAEALPADGLSSDMTSLDPRIVLLATEDLLFINKPSGRLVHGEASLEEELRDFLSRGRRDSLAFSPGPLHRLDRNTSGIVTFPRSSRGARVFSEMLRRGRIRKTYLAALSGRLEGGQYWMDLVARDSEKRLSSVLPAGATPENGEKGKVARTRVQPLLVSDDCTLAVIVIETGRTHQIRSQAAAHGHPLLGDAKYGGPFREGGYLLHARSLVFAEPPFADCPPEVEAPLPEEAATWIEGRFGGTALRVALEGKEDRTATVPARRH